MTYPIERLADDVDLHTDPAGAAMRTALLVIAAVLIVLGVVFTLQGIGLLGGSVMTGDRTWAVIGPILAIIGLVLGGWALRRRAPQS